MVLRRKTIEQELEDIFSNRLQEPPPDPVDLVGTLASIPQGQIRPAPPLPPSLPEKASREVMDLLSNPSKIQTRTGREDILLDDIGVDDLKRGTGFVNFGDGRVQTIEPDPLPTDRLELEKMAVFGGGNDRILARQALGLQREEMMKELAREQAQQRHSQAKELMKLEQQGELDIEKEKQRGTLEANKIKLQNKLPDIKTEQSLRKEVSANPIIKDTQEISSAVARMNGAWEDFQSTGDKNSLNAIDQALIISFNKMLDPGSVVRESEFARTPTGQALIEQAKGFLPKLERGGTGLTDTERQEIIRTANSLANAQIEEANKVKAFFEQRGTEIGIDPKNITGLFDFSKFISSDIAPSLTGQKVGDFLIESIE